MTPDFVSHLEELGWLRCPFGHRQEGSLQVTLSGTGYKAKARKTRTIPFSAAHSVNEGELSA